MMVSQLALVYGAYLLATASPGPSNMAIMGVAMRDGRRPALVLAAGVMTGSLCWAMLAATGLSAVLATYAQALWAIKIVGGVYSCIWRCALESPRYGRPLRRRAWPQGAMRGLIGRFIGRAC